jgi:phosphoribosyl 1,2-cyclic phosphodiesterase
MRTLARRMAAVQIAPESISAVFVTHEHIDHSRGVGAAQHKWRWEVFGSAGTLAGIPDLKPKHRHAVEPGTPVTVGTLAVTPIRVPHDAAAPTALLFHDTATGARAGLAHDLGMVTDGLRSAFRDLDLLLIESNHDDDMLMRGPYPPFLKERVASRTGHLSNRQCAELLRETASAALTDVVLLHLSATNNLPALAERCATEALRSARTRCRVTAAPHGVPAGPFGLPAAPAQFALAL